MLDRLRRSDAALAGALLVLFAGMLAEGARYPYDSRLLPTIVGVVGMAAAALLLLRMAVGAVRRAEKEEEGGGIGATPVWVAMLVPPVFGLVMWLFGFAVAAALAAFFVPGLMGERRLLRRLVLALGTVAALHLLFPVILNVPLPRGEIMDRIFEVPDDEY
jgi:putative tricarboxylic transport membrane protein